MKFVKLKSFFRLTILYLQIEMSQHYNDDDIVIVDGCRTPVGKLNGCLKTLTAHQLGSIVIKKLIEKCRLRSEDVSEVIMGQALTAGIKIVSLPAFTGSKLTVQGLEQGVKYVQR